jgi:uncharacterized protein
MSTNFFAAIKAGNVDEMQRLLTLDPSLIHTKDNGLSPVLVAVYHHQPQMASYIADKTVALTIFEASAIGRTNQVMMLLAHDPLLVNAVAEDGFQPLGLACFFGHKETVEYLLKAGARVNVFSQNPLHAAPIQSAAAASQLEIVVLLVQYGADVNVREQGGYTPLHAAAQNGDLDILRFLVVNGADQEARSDDGKTPLDLAVEAEKAEAVKYLKEGITRRFRSKRSPANAN